MSNEINVLQLTRTIRNSLVKQGFFPYATGLLKRNTTAQNIGKTQHDGKIYNTARINFNASTTPYVVYLEEGTRAHNIPKAFGRTNFWQPFAFEGDLTPYPFGIGGRFDGFFHPGSTKHKGFISVKSINFIINEINKRYEIDKIE